MYAPLSFFIQTVDIVHEVRIQDWPLGYLGLSLNISDSVGMSSVQRKPEDLNFVIILYSKISVVIKSHFKSESVSTLHMTQMLFVTFKKLGNQLRTRYYIFKTTEFSKAIKVKLNM